MTTAGGVAVGLPSAIVGRLQVIAQAQSTVQVHVSPMPSGRYRRLGEIISQDARLLTDRWLERAVGEYPQANRQRRDVMRDELPEYLAVLGGQLASTGIDDSEAQSQVNAREHGRQRWRSGWSLEEVVRDYQIMRLVVIQHLTAVLDPPLTIEEIQAVNLTLDDAITGSVVAFVEESQARYQQLNNSLEEKVVERTAQLRDLARALVEAEQRERRRIARLLHEHFQQLLFAIRMRLEKLRQGSNVKDEPLLDEMDNLLSEAIDDARSLSVGLNPTVLADGGLLPALQSLAELMLDRHELHVEFEIGDFKEPQTMEVAEFVYQAIRELLLNVVKHSGRRHARVAIADVGPNLLQIVVQDDGNGIPADAARPTATGVAGFGLADVRQRAEGLGGTLTVQSAQPTGTVVTLKVPT